MSATSKAKNAAKRYLSPASQERLKGVYRRLTGPRRPSRIKPVPTDAQGAARHYVLVAHSAHRAADFRRARLAMGEWILSSPRWRVPGAAA